MMPACCRRQFEFEIEAGRAASNSAIALRQQRLARLNRIGQRLGELVGMGQPVARRQLITGPPGAVGRVVLGRAMPAASRYAGGPAMVHRP